MRKRRVADRPERTASLKNAKLSDTALLQSEGDETPNFENARILTLPRKESIEERLAYIEQGLIRLETTMIRLERSNAATLSLFKSLLEWARNREIEQDVASPKMQ